MVDVLFFDYWTRGIRHFAKVKEGLEQKGLTSLLLHVGSRRGENVAREEVVEGVLCRDITYYGGSIVDAIIKEKPKRVLLLNSQTEDRIIIRACRAMGIKTAFLMHGVLAGAEDLNAVSKIIDSAFGLKSRLKRIPKYADLYRQYLRAASLAGLTSIFDPEIQLYFLRLMISPGKTLTNVWSYADSLADLAFVYSEDDKQLFVEKYGYKPEHIRIVGNYNLDPLYEDFEQNLRNKNLQIETTKKEGETRGGFLYIENGFADPKYPVAGWSEELVSAEIKGLAELLRQYRFDLYVKLHPSSDYSVLIEEISDIKNVKIFNRCDLSNLILESDVVLGQSSSVLMMALAVNKPILLLSLPPLEIKVRQYLDKAIGPLISSMNDFEHYVQAFSEKNHEIKLMNSDSRERFIGPFDGKCNLRIVDEICKLGVMDDRRSPLRDQPAEGNPCLT